MSAMSLQNVSDDLLQSLALVARAGASNAARALSAFSGNALTVSDASAQPISLPDVPTLGGHSEETIVGIYFTMEGHLSGSVLATFSMKEAQELLSAFGIEDEGDELSVLALSALAESGNIIVSAFLTTLEPLCGLQVLPSPPVVVIEMRGAILSSAVLPVVDAGGTVLVVDASILPVGMPMTDVMCNMCFLPTPDSWQILSRALITRTVVQGA